MAKGSLNFFEMHVEKIVAGLAAAFLIYLVVAYLVMSPNAVDNNGEQIAPGQVNEKVLATALDVEHASNNAQPPKEAGAPAKYSELVATYFNAGILKPIPSIAGMPPTPNVPPTIVGLAPRGKPAPNAGAVGPGDTGPKVALVAPLAPSLPAASTGRSMAIRR